MSDINIVGTGRRVRKFVGFVGVALVLAAFWFAHMAIVTSNAACPPGVTIGDINHGAGGPECGKAMLYWFYAVVSFLVSAVVILAWIVMRIMSFLIVVRK
jgi:hypothetical protein